MERNAMEIVFKFVLAIATLPTALGGQLPPTLAQSPGLFGHGAPIALCLGCIVSLAGMLRRDRVKGMAVQLVGLSMVAAGATFYALALGLFAPDFAQARVAVGMSLGIGLGAIARYGQVSRELAGLPRRPRRKR